MWTFYQIILSLFMTAFTIGLFCYWSFKYKWKYSIKDKVVLITGACNPKGLGLNLAGIAKTYNARTIIITSRNEKEGLNALNYLDGVPGDGNVIHVTLDLNWSDDKINSLMQDLFQKVGGIDILIASAGVSYRGEALKTSLDVHKSIMQINYFGNVSLINTVADLMKKNQTEDGYYIVGISSIQGRISIPFRSAYSASKHAFCAFLDCLRAEVSKDNIRVLNVLPSYINTNLSTNAIRDSGKKHSQVDENTRNGMPPEEVAASVFAAIRGGQEEIALLNIQSRIALFLRTILPSLFFFLMHKRAESSKAY